MTLSVAAFSQAGQSRSLEGRLEGDELRAALDQSFVRCDEWGGCLVDQNGRVSADSLRTPHRDALVPKGVALPELNTFCGILGILLPEVVLLNEYNLRGGWE
ncbi:unnamed protein product [Sphagnum troendelagicum]|uniref:Uncharacterized protein n=1 Tax=Sphagnum troendelagicum TaxID=128251 RepID=A0ABP0USZ3_9BRYO